MGTVGVDIGGTRTRVGLVDAGRVVARRAFPTQGMTELKAAIREVLVQAGRARPEAIGVGAPAPMDMRAGRILGCPNLPQWNCVDVGPELAAEFACPVLLANDATCAAIGELAFGHRVQDFAYITWSTGIGGGLVSGGRVVWGATGQAGEVGHMVIRPGGPPCRCGKQGCLEAIASGTGIARAAREKWGHELSAAEVVDRARAGDAAAAAIVDDACQAVGQALAVLWEVLDPQVLVLGGGLTQSWELLGPKVEEVARRLARGTPVILLTELGDDVGLLGAAALPDYYPSGWAEG
ncbi:MAG: ROK family protein [Candidatus Bipolaricaulaceae bacterium]